MFLQQELKGPAMYNAIISTIAGGASRLNEIATKIHEDSQKVSKYLHTLVSLKIIQRLYPFGDNPLNSRRGKGYLLSSGNPPSKKYVPGFCSAQTETGNCPLLQHPSAHGGEPIQGQKPKLTST